MFHQKNYPQESNRKMYSPIGIILFFASGMDSSEDNINSKELKSLEDFSVKASLYKPPSKKNKTEI